MVWGKRGLVGWLVCRFRRCSRKGYDSIAQHITVCLADAIVTYLRQRHAKAPSQSASAGAATHAAMASELPPVPETSAVMTQQMEGWKLGFPVSLSTTIDRVRKLRV